MCRIKRPRRAEPSAQTNLCRTVHDAMGRHRIGMAARILMAAACAVIASPSSAQSQQRTIRFGTTGDYPPFAHWRGDGTLDGADAVMARRVARSMKARAVFVPTSWASLNEDFRARRFDIAIGGLTVLPDRAAIGTFSTPFMQDGKRPLALCRHRSLYASLADIDRAGVRVEINRGVTMAQLARQWFTTASLTVNPDDATLADWLLQGKADVLITDGTVVDRMAALSRGRLCATTRQPFTHVTKAWLIQNDPDLIASVNQGLARAFRRGGWDKALRKAGRARP